MYIPHWCLLVLAWTTLGVLMLGVMAGLLYVALFLVNFIMQGAQLILAFLGFWAAFFNYITVLRDAVDGGKDWVCGFISPQKPFDSRVTKSYSDPVSYFKIHPHPEAWRWWMLLLGWRKAKN